MRLDPRGKSRGSGNKANIQIKSGPGGGMIRQRQMFKPGPPGVYCSRIGFPPPALLGAPQNFGEFSGFNVGPPRHTFSRFPRNNFKKKFPVRSNNTPVLEIDLKKPWVNEEIKNEETKKQELLQIWRKTNTNEDWSKYNAQKLTVQSLYDKAKSEYASSHPNQAILWENISTKRNYYCETCDKSFRTDDDLFLHETEHETCGRDGCEFTAHRKIIWKHIKMQHLSGLYNRIGKLSSEEDIAKWIEERKKRYPTRKLVEEKKILEEQKLNRGERIKDNDSKFNKKFQKNEGNSKKKFQKTQKNRNRRARRKKCLSLVQKCLEEEKTIVFRQGVPAFLGIKDGKKQEVIEKNDLNISDEEWEIKYEPPTSVKPVLNKSLGLVAAVYDSEEENQNGNFTEEAKIEVMSSDEGSGPEEVATVSSKNQLAKENPCEEKFPPKRKLSDKKCNQENKRQNISNVSNGEKRDLTLLEKLLKNEIRHERNVILQCVHFVVKNNFFKT